MTGGPAITLTPITGPASGGAPSWGADDAIVFATISGSASGKGLLRVRAAGGEPEVLTMPDGAQGERGHPSPQVLPGGEALLFSIFRSGAPDASDVAVLNLRTGTWRVLVRGAAYARYVPPGYLVYALGGTLRAVAFDLSRLAVLGSAVPVIEGRLTGAVSASDFDVANDGTLVYVSAGAQAGAERTLAWVDRQGREEVLEAPTRAYIYPRLSPDGTRIAIAVTDQENDVWIWDLSQRAPLRRFTFDAALDIFPVWAQGGQRLVWGSTRAGFPSLYWQAADGTGPVERLTDSAYGHYPLALTPDGMRLVLRQTGTAETGQDLMMLEVDGNRLVTPLIQTGFNEQNGEISPDSRWLAYESDESGRFEVYVRPFPDVNAGRWQISVAGGRQSLWSRSGRELFYRAPNGAVIGVSANGTSSSGFNAGTPTTLVRGPYYNGSGAFLGRTYDVSPDGRRFLMIKERSGTDQTADGPAIVVVQNWVEELKRLVPSSN